MFPLLPSRISSTQTGPHMSIYKSLTKRPLLFYGARHRKRLKTPYSLGWYRLKSDGCTTEIHLSLCLRASTENTQSTLDRSSVTTGLVQSNLTSPFFWEMEDLTTVFSYSMLCTPNEILLWYGRKLFNRYLQPTVILIKEQTVVSTSYFQNLKKKNPH